MPMTHTTPWDSHSPGTVFNDPARGSPPVGVEKPRAEGMAGNGSSGLIESP